MKYITTLIIAFVFSLHIGAQGIDFFHGSWEEAIELAKKEQKAIFVDAYAVWCGPCKRMAKDVFPLEDVGEFYNSHFINVKMDMERGEGPRFGKQFPVRAYPTLLFISPQEEKIHEHVGGLNGEMLIQVGETALSKFGGGGNYAQDYKEGKRDFETVLGYLKGLARSGQSGLKVANDFLDEKGSELSREQRDEIIFAAASEADSKLFEEMIERKDAMIELYSEAAVKDRVRSACEATVKKAIQYKFPDLIEEAINKYAEFENHYEAVNVFEHRSYMDYYAAFKDFENYMEHADAYLRTNEGQQLQNQKIVAGEMVRVFGQTAYDEALVIWEYVAKEEKENPENHFMLAQLYKEQGEERKAIKAVEEAIDLAKEQKTDHGRYQSFMNELKS